MSTSKNHPDLDIMEAEVMMAQPRKLWNVVKPV
jgi:hypothetical protein